MKKLLLAIAVLFVTGAAFAAPAQSAAAVKPTVQDSTPRSVAFKTVDGWTISANYRAPAEGKPVLVFLHSHKEDSSIWKPVTSKTDAMGFGRLLLDFRGHGSSTQGPNGETKYTAFDRETGPENNYNKMTEDVNAALDFLNGEGVTPDRVILVGAGLGANIAIKSAAEHKDIAMMALFTPTLNANRDVLTVNPLNNYGARPVFVAASVENARLYQEVALLRAILYHRAGWRNVTFVTAEKGSSSELITPAVTDSFLLWLECPSMPEPVDYRPPNADDGTEGASGAEPADEGVADDSALPDNPGVPVEDDGLGDENYNTSGSNE